MLAVPATAVKRDAAAMGNIPSVRFLFLECEMKKSKAPIHSSVGLYFPLPPDATNELRSRLNDLAASHGYVARRGPTAGRGNLVALLIAIDAGEVITVPLDDDKLLDALNALERIEAQWAQDIVSSLLAARARRTDISSIRS